MKSTNESLTIRVWTVQSLTLPVRQGFHPMNLTSVRSEVLLKSFDITVLCSLCLSFVWKEDCVLLAHLKLKKELMACFLLDQMCYKTAGENVETHSRFDLQK